MSASYSKCLLVEVQYLLVTWLVDSKTICLLHGWFVEFLSISGVLVGLVRFRLSGCSGYSAEFWLS